jgi:hypothetical protein
MIILIIMLLFALLMFSGAVRRGTFRAQLMSRTRKQWRAEDEAAKAATPKAIAKAAKEAARKKKSLWQRFKDDDL